MPTIRFNTEKSDLLDEYKKMARLADDRLRSLEKATLSRSGFEHATDYAYKKAQKDIVNRFGTPDNGKYRFNKLLPKSYTKAQIKAAMNDIRDFVAKPSSSVAGILRIYKKRMNTLNEKYADSGLNMTLDDMDKLFKNNTWDKITARYASDTAWKKIGERTKEIEKQRKLLEEAGQKIHYDDNPFEAAIDQLANETGKLKITDLK